MEAAAAHSMKQPAQHLQNLRDLLQQKNTKNYRMVFLFLTKSAKSVKVHFLNLFLHIIGSGFCSSFRMLFTGFFVRLGDEINCYAFCSAGLEFRGFRMGA